MQTERKITAVLGPTNTGKTHLAIERMLGHRTGMIGCPLRLLAREIYDKVAAVKGSANVALITGEERIVPKNPRFYVCTTESMPTEKLVDFLAVDEIQLAADPERGHVFTDRMLHARGLGETMFLGSLTIESMIKALIPRAEIISRPRFSKLTYSGEKKLTRLQPRTAIVTFSASELYLMAESIRRLRGGSAVVLGALSPRTRNAQVEMFENGEVDYLIATDAIGMGLNLDVHHVAFAQLKKFDGRRRRSLIAAEIAQIAGRAGRYSRDGTFGSTAGAGPIPDEIVSAVEEHEFPELPHIYWRNRDLRFESTNLLLESLEENPASTLLLKPHNAEDTRALRALIVDPSVKARATSQDSISLLWEVCRVPDFQQILSDTHFQLLKEIFLHLSGPTARLPDDWVQKMSRRLDQTAGDIETLSGRIAHIRTWNYIANRPNWVSDPQSLQNTTRQIEDRLSDALHERLTQRFVDRRTRAIVKGYDASGQESVTIKPEGSLSVASETVGRIQGINFILGDNGTPPPSGVLENTIRGAVSSKLRQQVDLLCQSNNRELTLLPNFTINWGGGAAGRLQAGKSILKPKITSINNDMLDGQTRDRIQQRLQSWWEQYLASMFKSLFRIMNLASSGASRAIAFRLLEGLGNTPRDECQTLINALTPEEQKLLNKSNVRFGRRNLFVPTMLKTRVISLRDRLWQLYSATEIPPPKGGRVTMRIARGVNPNYYYSIGYQPLGPLALRVDILERLSAKLRQKAQSGTFELDPALISLVGTRKADLEEILNRLGYQQINVSEPAQCSNETNITPSRNNSPIYKKSSTYGAISKKNRRKKPKSGTSKVTPSPNTSPFAVLQNLKFPKK